ncbi:MAG TPA: polysaccharide biosynthesis/export family protein [Candidatus Acidoferrum sp.]|nr:polysaccharide biosynthesis/export family protein [Candidatus Acidoferrum sp.]
MLRKLIAGGSVAILFAMLLPSAASAQTTTSQSTNLAKQAVRENSNVPGDDFPRPALEHRNPRYELHSADVLELHFPFTPEFNQTVTVQPDGFISLLGVESVYVQGQTLPQVTALLRRTYGKILHEPEINVILKDFEKPYFIVGGQVGHPGKFDLRADTTASEAVAIAGGFTTASKHSQVYLFHRVQNGWMEAKKLNLKKMLKGGDLNEDVYLQPGDFLYVPQNAFSKFDRFIPTSTMGLYASPPLR